MLLLKMTAMLNWKVGKKRSPCGRGRVGEKGKKGGQRGKQRLGSPEAWIFFPEGPGKPLVSLKQETCRIQLMIENDDFGCGVGKSALCGDGQESQQTSEGAAIPGTRGFCRRDKKKMGICSGDRWLMEREG